MKKIFTLVFLLVFIKANTQLLSWTPSFIQESSTPIDIIVDATKGNLGLKDYSPTTDVYVHTGVITNLSTSSSDWKHVKYSSFNTPSPTVQAVYLGSNKWKFTITGGLRNFYGLTNAAEKIQNIAILFRNGNGTKKQANSDGSDMYIPVYDGGFNVRIDQPYKEPTYVPTLEPINKTLGDNIAVTANASQASTLKLYLNGTQFGSTAANATTISGNASITGYGTQTLVAEAVNGATTKYDTITFLVNPPSPVAALPAGVRDGINYWPSNDSVTLVLYAPSKTRVAVLGDFNNWTETLQHQMNKTPDGLRYWITIKGLTPGVEYGYQYLIDGSLKVADYMTEKVLDPNNDQYIPASTYPSLKAYPKGKTTGMVSIFQTAKPVYNWQVQNFTKPDKRNLIIYELLVRDFVSAQNWQTVKDSISYLKKLGINAIEVMPFNEFEGNNSWGYNPDFYFAPDKIYGPENSLRQFVDECHKQGIAVIMDIAMNHAFGQSPTVQMYFNSATNKPAANNPWHNVDATHAFNVGYDFNHEAPATKALVDRVIEHWLTQYKIDGFRWDLSKGFTQTNTCPSGNCDVGAWSNYDAGRVAIWKRIYDKTQSTVAGSYCILEHFAANNEEIELSNYGMLLWGNANYNYNEATMGFVGTSNFEGGIYTNRQWQQPNLVTYQESHDEERLMYKNELYANSSGGYNIRDTATGLKRNAMATAFWAMTPAPKMMWQFGELGYDYSINTCENGTVNNDCRVSPKPIKWSYLNNPNRVALFNVYSKLFKLRNIPNYLKTFITNDVSYSLGGGFKTLKVNSDSLKVLVIGNFDVKPLTDNVTFQNAGVWYNYLSGGLRVATGLPESITLQPGEYYVYVNRNADSLAVTLPIKLVSFNAVRGNNEINVNWNTSYEINIKNYLIERSFNGVDFSNVSLKTSSNKGAITSLYNYSDKDPIALYATGTIYYRLKTINNDGSYSYSSIVSISPLKMKGDLTILPNPVKTGRLLFRLNEDLQTSMKVKVEDIGGRLYRSLSTAAGNGTNYVDLSNMSNGVYVLKVETATKVYVRQFVIQR